jgi:hypothetical protein
MNSGGVLSRIQPGSAAVVIPVSSVAKPLTRLGHQQSINKRGGVGQDESCWFLATTILLR